MSDPSDTSSGPNPQASSRPVRERPAKARARLAVLLLALVALPPLLFHHRLHEPLGSDAQLLTHRNRFMQDAEGLRAVWTRDFFEGAETGQVTYRSGYYRPVTNTFLWLVHAAAGSDARVYNLVQTLLHGLCSALAALVFLLLARGFPPARALERGPDPSRASGAPAARGASGGPGTLWSTRGAVGMAAGAGLLFAVHPVQAFAATEPAAVADVLFPVFFLLAMASFEFALGAGSTRGRTAGVAATVTFYALAVLSKEMGVTLPAVLVLQVVHRRLRGDVPWDRLAWTLPAWGVLAAYAGWRFGFLDLPMHANRYAEQHGWPAVLAAGPRSFLIHVSRALAPLQPGHPELLPTLLNRLRSPWTDPLAWAGIAVTAGFLGAATALWKRLPHVAFWAAFALVTFSPLLVVERIGRGLAPDVVLTQERWFYLPFLGVAALVVLGVRTALERAESRRGRRLVAGTAGAALVLLALAARVHAGKHDDPFAQLRTLYLFPEEELSRQELANRLLLYAHFVALPRGDTADAVARGRRAVRLTPDSPLSAASFATILASRGRWTEVREQLEPWYDPPARRLAAAAETNPRVYDDLNRSGTRLTLLLGRALTHTGEPRRGRELVCEALRAGAAAAEVDAAIAEVRRAGVEPAGCPPGTGPARQSPPTSRRAPTSLGVT